MRRRICRLEKDLDRLEQRIRAPSELARVIVITPESTISEDRELKPGERVVRDYYCDYTGDGKHWGSRERITSNPNDHGKLFDRGSNKQIGIRRSTGDFVEFEADRPRPPTVYISLSRDARSTAR